jgi:xanthine dehydrogenase small subunit
MTPPDAPPLRMLRRGLPVSLTSVPPDRTLLQVLREDLGLRSVKEGCAEGDCGACTVALAAIEEGTLRWRAVNSCIRLAHSVDGMAVWTAEDLDQDPCVDLGGAPLHPAQQALVAHHGSQCGFCTPGFVMSLYARYHDPAARGQALTPEEARQTLSGNLCRCTGYRPILEAATAMHALPPARLDEPRLRRSLEALSEAAAPAAPRAAYLAPTSLPGLLQARARHPGTLLVAGGTDVGLWITKGGQRHDRVLDLTRVAELRRVERYRHHIAIGAAVTLQDAFAALLQERPSLAVYLDRFAALPVRHSGTLGGNVANGSPIGDSMPLLIALGASVVLMRWDPRRGGRIEHRELALEDLYLGYRQTRLAQDEVLAWIKVPRPGRPCASGAGVGHSGEWVRAYKVSKRFEDDISAVTLAVQLRLKRGRVVAASIGAGGVGPVPLRATRTEAALADRPWTADTVRAAMDTLRQEVRPISDLRASADYRLEVLGQLLWRAWLESPLDEHDAPVTLDGLQPLPREPRP